MVNSFAANLVSRISRNIAVIFSSTELMMRLLGVVFIYVLLIIPAFVAVMQWMVDIFSSNVNVSIGAMLFEALVICVVFWFGVSLIYAVVHECPELHFAIQTISFVMVTISAFVMAQISNRCIWDLNCELWKYLAGLMMVTGIAATGAVLPRWINRSAALYGLWFLVVAVVQSDIWLFHALTKTGIPPTPGAWRALFLLIYTVFLLVCFVGGGIQPAREPPRRR